MSTKDKTIHVKLIAKPAAGNTSQSAVGLIAFGFYSMLSTLWFRLRR